MNRKEQHIEQSLLMYSENNMFKKMKIYPFSIPIFPLSSVDISTSFLGHNFRYPFYINAMTGGSKISYEINKRLANISKETGIFLFLGSFSMGLKNKYLESYEVAINSLDQIGLNIGIDKPLEDMEYIIRKYKPTFLQVHVNATQEYIQGNLNFNNWLSNLKNLKTLNFPVILKETGFGMSREMIDLAYQNGIKCIDISGRGGTDFAKIENEIVQKPKRYFQKWGLTTYESLIEAKPYIDKIDILASGGITNPIEIVKCLILGAKAVGLSGHVLDLMEHYPDEKVIDILNGYKDDIRYILSTLGVDSITKLREVRWIYE